MFPLAIEEYRRPKTLIEARSALEGYDRDDIVMPAGGQSINQAIKTRMVRQRSIVGLQGLAELEGGRRRVDPAPVTPSPIASSWSGRHRRICRRIIGGRMRRLLSGVAPRYPHT